MATSLILAEFFAIIAAFCFLGSRREALTRLTSESLLCFAGVIFIIVTIVCLITAAIFAII